MCILVASGSVKVTLRTLKSSWNHGRVVQIHTSTEKEKIMKKGRLRLPLGMLLGAFWRPLGSQSDTKSSFEDLCFSGWFSMSKLGGRGFWEPRDEMAGGPLEEINLFLFWDCILSCCCWSVTLKTRSRAKARWRIQNIWIFINDRDLLWFYAFLTFFDVFILLLDLRTYLER